MENRTAVTTTPAVHPVPRYTYYIIRCTARGNYYRTWPPVENPFSPWLIEGASSARSSSAIARDDTVPPKPIAVNVDPRHSIHPPPQPPPMYTLQGLVYNVVVAACYCLPAAAAAVGPTLSPNTRTRVIYTALHGLWYIVI